MSASTGIRSSRRRISMLWPLRGSSLITTMPGLHTARPRVPFSCWANRPIEWTGAPQCIFVGNARRLSRCERPHPRRRDSRPRIRGLAGQDQTRAKKPNSHPCVGRTAHVCRSGWGGADNYSVRQSSLFLSAIRADRRATKTNSLLIYAIGKNTAIG